eukprot:GHVS01008150.1.p1 GENE.GHVS01008150.1~~GHVS01008150.1.p1  ORF type:complete len:1569 (+),score=272.83 GHVS01008150.1:371-5077(+)
MNSSTTAMNSSTTATNSPITATNSPTAATNSPTAATNSPTAATNSPTAATNSPTAATSNSTPTLHHPSRPCGALPSTQPCSTGGSGRPPPLRPSPASVSAARRTSSATCFLPSHRCVGCPGCSPTGHVNAAKARLVHFLTNCFSRYAELVYDHSIAFIVVSFIVCVMCGIGMIYRQTEFQMYKLYSLPDTHSQHAKSTLLSTFTPERISYIFITSTENSLSKSVLNQLDHLHKQIVNITINTPDVTTDEFGNPLDFPSLSSAAFSVDDLPPVLAYSDLCVRDAWGRCSHQSILDAYYTPLLYGRDLVSREYPQLLNIRTQQAFRVDALMGNVTVEERMQGGRELSIIHNATAFALRHDLTGADGWVHYSAAFERKLVEVVQNFTIEGMDISVKAERSINDELARASRMDFPDQVRLGIAISLVVLYSVIANSSCSYRNKSWVALMGVMAALLGYVGGTGLLHLFGLLHTPPAEATPFLVIGIGVDDVFVMLNSYSLTYLAKSSRQRVCMAVRDAGISITITTLTNIIAFIIGAVSPYFSVSRFCIITATSLLMGYIMCLTFFLGWLCLDARREERGSWWYCQKRNSRKGAVVDIRQGLEEERQISTEKLMIKDRRPNKINEQLITQINWDDDDARDEENTTLAPNTTGTNTPLSPTHREEPCPQGCTGMINEDGVRTPTNSTTMDLNRSSKPVGSRKLPLLGSSAASSAMLPHAKSCPALQRFDDEEEDFEEFCAILVGPNAPSGNGNLAERSGAYGNHGAVGNHGTDSGRTGQRHALPNVSSEKYGINTGYSSTYELVAQQLLLVESIRRRRRTPSIGGGVYRSSTVTTSCLLPETTNTKEERNGKKPMVQTREEGVKGDVAVVGGDTEKRRRVSPCGVMVQENALDQMAEDKVICSVCLQPAEKEEHGLTSSSAPRRTEDALHQPTTGALRQTKCSTCLDPVVTGWLPPLPALPSPTSYFVSCAVNCNSDNGGGGGNGGNGGSSSSGGNGSGNGGGGGNGGSSSMGNGTGKEGGLDSVEDGLDSVEGNRSCGGDMELAVGRRVSSSDEEEVATVVSDGSGGTSDACTTTCVTSNGTGRLVEKGQEGSVEEEEEDLTNVHGAQDEITTEAGIHFDSELSGCDGFPVWSDWPPPDACDGSCEHTKMLEEPAGNVGRLFRKFFLLKYGRWLRLWWVKALVLLVFSVYVGGAIWGLEHLKSGLSLKDVTPDKSYLREFYDTRDEYFTAYGEEVVVFFAEAEDWHHKFLQDEFLRLRDAINGSEYCVHMVEGLGRFLEDRADVLEDGNKESFTAELRDWLAVDIVGKRFRDSFNFDEDNTTLLAWKFYYWMPFVDNTRLSHFWLEDVRAMLRESDAFHGLAYTPLSVMWESDPRILEYTLTNMAIALGAIVLVATVLIPDVLSAVLVVAMIVMVDLGLFGYMTYWNLELNMLTMVNLLISIGFSVDYTAHMVHTFTHCVGPTRQHRIVETLVIMGSPVTHGMISTLLSVFVLSTADKYALVVFFQMMSMVLLFAFAHGVILLPVLLSLVGPMPMHHRKKLSNPTQHIQESLEDEERGEDVALDDASLSKMT